MIQCLRYLSYYSYVLLASHIACLLFYCIWSIEVDALVGQ